MGLQQQTDGGSAERTNACRSLASKESGAKVGGVGGGNGGGRSEGGKLEVKRERRWQQARLQSNRVAAVARHVANPLHEHNKHAQAARSQHEAWGSDPRGCLALPLSWSPCSRVRSLTLTVS